MEQETYNIKLDIMSRKLFEHLKEVNYENIDTKIKSFQKKTSAFKTLGNKNISSKV